MPSSQNSETNVSYLNVLRSVISPLSGMIGLSSYYGQKINSSTLSSINSLLFTKKTVADVLSLNSLNNNKTKYINSSHKILLGLGTIGLANYAKFVNNTIEPIIPTTTVSPVNMTNSFFENYDLLLNTNDNSNNLMDWNTYISLNSYGAGSIASGIIELLPERFNSVKKIVNSLTAGALISTGIVMGEKNGYDNCYAIPTIISGINDIANQVIPINSPTSCTTVEAESLLNSENPRINDYGSHDNINGQSYQQQEQSEEQHSFS